MLQMKFNENISTIQKKYEEILLNVCHLSYNEAVIQLIKIFPSLWIEFYKMQSNRLTDICTISHGSFEFIYDDTDSLIEKGIMLEDTQIASRIVAVYGKSSPSQIKRDDYRLRGWVGPTNQIFGEKWDKGHFIAHSIGGAVDKMELNVFKQKRELNRGWSHEGKIYRKMEQYCFRNPGTFCYNRPIYGNQSDKPSFIEYGLLKHTNELWYHCFNNQTEE